MSYYSTAAQVIPLLFLALVFEQRIIVAAKFERHVYFGVETDRRTPRGMPVPRYVGVLVAGLVAALVLGEAHALGAIKCGPSATADYFTTGGMVVAGIVVLSPVVAQAARSLLPHPSSAESDTHKKAGTIALKLLAVGVAAYMIVGVLVWIL